MSEPTSNRVASLAPYSSKIALASVFLAFCAFNTIAMFLSNEDHDRVWIAILGAMIFEPVLLGMWTALATGSFLTRIPITSACLMILFVVPASNSAAFKEVQRTEFVAAVAAGLTVFIATALLFLLARRLFQIRIESAAHENRTRGAGVRFSIKYLLALVTLYAVILGLVSQLSFQTKPNYSFFSGPDLFLFMIVVGAPVALAAISPILAVPLLILYRGPRGRTVPSAVAFWAVVSFLVIVISMANGPESFPDSIEAMFLFQAGALLAGVLAAIPLRLAGTELVKSPRPARIPPTPSP